MICQICKEQNDADDAFCRGCGNPLAQATVVFNNHGLKGPFHEPQPPAGTNSRALLYGLIGVLVVAIGGFVGYLGMTSFSNTAPLPNHFGIFAKKDDGLRELPKKELKDFIGEKASLLNQDSIPVLASKPEMIVFSGDTIPTDKLKLVALDSVKDDGNYNYVEFQIAPVRDKPDMREFRTTGELANGKYAFAVFDGFLNDGNHKFWTFQISNSAVSETASLLKASVELKPTPTPPAIVNAFIPPPPNSTVGVCNNRNVLLRSSPSLTASPIGKVQNGQTVYVTEVSSNYDFWGGISSNWAYVQLPNGKRGWMFHHFVTYR